MTLKSNPRFVVGCAGIHAGKRRHLIGYWVGAGYRKRGYAREAARALAQYGFDMLNLTDIEIACRVNNPASRRMIEKLGARSPRLSLQESRILARRVPTLVYTLTCDDWARRAANSKSSGAVA